MFWLLHIQNCLTFSVLIPLRSPCTPFANCAHLSVDCENTSNDYTDYFANYAHNINDYANTLDDQANTIVDLTDTLDISSIDFCIPNPALL
jgi:hypothetical protein